jgi:hypothetical protein
MGATRGAETANSSRAPEYTPGFILNDNKLNSYTTVYQIKKEKPIWNQVSPIKIEGQTSQWAKKNGQTSIDKRINRKTKDRVTQIWDSLISSGSQFFQNFRIH